MSPNTNVRYLRRLAAAAQCPGRRLSANWPAEIDSAGKTADCTVLDVSSGGAKLRVDCLPAGVTELSLVLRARGAIAATIVWQEHNQVGLSFHQEQNWVREVSKERFDPAAWLHTSCST